MSAGSSRVAHTLSRIRLAAGLQRQMPATVSLTGEEAAALLGYIEQLSRGLRASPKRTYAQQRATAHFHHKRKRRRGDVVMLPADFDYQGFSLLRFKAWAKRSPMLTASGFSSAYQHAPTQR